MAAFVTMVSDICIVIGQHLLPQPLGGSTLRNYNSIINVRTYYMYSHLSHYEVLQWKDIHEDS